MEENIKELYSSGIYKPEKDDNGKFWWSIVNANPKTIEILKQYAIVLTKGSQLKVIVINEREMLQKLELAVKMSFFEEYKKDPSRLTQPVTNIIKRMARCDAEGINYRDEQGQIKDFIFNQLKFNEEMQKYNHVSKVEPAKEELNLNVDIFKLKDYASRLVEVYGLFNDKDTILNRVESVATVGFGYKETLLEVFKVYGVDPLSLNQKIDEIIETKESVKMVA